MAMTLYSGFVGSGKSYHATAEAVAFAEAIKGNGWVVANFPIKPKKRRFFKGRKTRWIFKDNFELSPGYLVNKSLEMGWDKKENSCLLIFDEAAILFNARDWAKNNDRMEWVKFFTQSRKFGYDIIFISQDQRMLDRQIRNLCEYETTHRKLNNWSFFKFLPFSVFVCVSYWNGTNARYSKGRLKLCVYRKRVAERYDTKALFGYGDEYQQSDDELKSTRVGTKGSPTGA